MIEEKKKPDYDVSLLNKVTEAKGKIGAAWKNKDGTISIILNPFVTVHQEGKDLLITLFPRKSTKKQEEIVYGNENSETPPF